MDLKTFDGQTVEGRLSLKEPGSMEKDTYTFDATFKAPILRKKIPTAAELKAMADSPAVKRHWRSIASRGGNVAALKAAVVPEMAKELDGPDGKQIVEMLKVTSLEKADGGRLSRRRRRHHGEARGEERERQTDHHDEAQRKVGGNGVAEP